MASCAFFGHSDFDYDPYRDKLRNIIIDLIENRGVTEFYSGGRGKFDGMCARLVWELRSMYPNVKNILVLSYIPGKNFELDPYFDESVYLLDTRVPPKFAISYTNRKLVETANYVITGIARRYGGAKKASDYAQRLLKSMINVVTDEEQFFDDHSEREVDKMVQKYRERLASDDDFRKAEEENKRKIYEKINPNS